MSIISCDCTVTLALARLDQPSAAGIIVLPLTNTHTMQPSTQPSSLQNCTNMVCKVPERKQKRGEAAAAWTKSVLCTLPYTSYYSQTFKLHIQQGNKLQKI